LKELGILAQIPFISMVGAISVGIVDREQLLDLCYQEDFAASVDFNVVMTDKGNFVELQGTAEGKPFSRRTVDSLISLAESGIKQLFTIQKAAINQFS
jgi:ribonuclease PH